MILLLFLLNQHFSKKKIKKIFDCPLNMCYDQFRRCDNAANKRSKKK